VAGCRPNPKPNLINLLLILDKRPRIRTTPRAVSRMTQTPRLKRRTTDEKRERKMPKKSTRSRDKLVSLAPTLLIHKPM
jgi:hypothetical protein